MKSNDRQMNIFIYMFMKVYKQQYNKNNKKRIL